MREARRLRSERESRTLTQAESEGRDLVKQVRSHLL
jgi:hypothetical protein